VSAEYERVILHAYQIYKSGPVILKKIINPHFGFTIPHNKIYRVMLMHQLIVENPQKKCQRRWVRFERKHSMSLRQGDWKHLVMNETDTWVIAFIDDSSRLITCYGTFDHPTTENAIVVLKQGFETYGTPREILTDHCPQFVAARDRDHARHTFSEFLMEYGVCHIVTRISHPQTNGKIERWFGLPEQKFGLFNSIDEFVQ
jgi:putative transposase